MKISIGQEVSAMNAHFEADDAAVCPTCLGYGFRVGTGPGKTVNARTALSMPEYAHGQRILCHCQIEKAEAIKNAVATAPSISATPKPKRVRGGTKKQVVTVAGRKPSAYVDTAEV